MAQDNEGIFTSTVPAPSTFPNLLEAKAVMKAGKATGEPKYSLNIEFEPDSDDLKAAKAKAAAVAKAKWPGRDFSEIAFPFSSGDKLADKAKAKGKDREFSRGKVVLTARSKYEPRLSVIENGKLVDYEGDKRPTCKSKFYNGVEVLFQVNFQAYDGVGNGQDGVTAYLNMAVSLNKGTKLSGGGSSAAEVFKGYVGVASQEDPTLEDEISF